MCANTGPSCARCTADRLPETKNGRPPPPCCSVRTECTCMIRGGAASMRRPKQLRAPSCRLTACSNRHQKISLAPGSSLAARVGTHSMFLLPVIRPGAAMHTMRAAALASHLPPCGPNPAITALHASCSGLHSCARQQWDPAAWSACMGQRMAGQGLGMQACRWPPGWMRRRTAGCWLCWKLPAQASKAPAWSAGCLPPGTRSAAAYQPHPVNDGASMRMCSAALPPGIQQLLGSMLYPI